MRKWITFHRGVGVEQFLLYNNNSSDGFREAMSEFDCVTLIEWPYAPPPAFLMFRPLRVFLPVEKMGKKCRR